MKIKFLGTGGAFQVEDGNAAAVVEIDGLKLLLDCGYSVFPRLVRSGLSSQIDALLISHLHDDHVGSLSSFLIYRQMKLRKGKIKLIYPNEAFRTTLADFLAFSIGNAEDWVEFVPIAEYPNITAIDTFGHHVPGMQTWAFMFREGDDTIVFSSDLAQPEALFAQLEAMELPGKPLVFHEMIFEKSFGHTYYRELIPYLDRFRVYGYHHDHRLNPPDNPIPLVANTPEFLY